MCFIHRLIELLTSGRSQDVWDFGDGRTDGLRLRFVKYLLLLLRLLWLRRLRYLSRLYDHRSVAGDDVLLVKMMLLVRIHAVYDYDFLFTGRLHLLQGHRQRCSVAMKLGTMAIPAGRGRAHRDRCLRALALYGRS